MEGLIIQSAKYKKGAVRTMLSFVKFESLKAHEFKNRCFFFFYFQIKNKTF